MWLGQGGPARDLGPGQAGPVQICISALCLLGKYGAFHGATSGRSRLAWLANITAVFPRRAAAAATPPPSSGASDLLTHLTPIICHFGITKLERNPFRHVFSLKETFLST